MVTTMIQTEAIIRIIEHEKFIVGLRNDGIVHVYFVENTEINVELQSIMLEYYMEITNGNKAPFIFEGGEFISVTKEARENAIKIEGTTPTSASAILVRNLAQKIIADFYYFVNKPKQPYKVFSDFDKAIAWLNALNLTE